MPIETVFKHFDPINSPCPWEDLTGHYERAKYRLANLSGDEIIKQGKLINWHLTIRTWPSLGCMDRRPIALANTFLEHSPINLFQDEEEDIQERIRDLSVTILVMAGLYHCMREGVQLIEDEDIAARLSRMKLGLPGAHQGLQTLFLKHEINYRDEVVALTTLANTYESHSAQFPNAARSASMQGNIDNQTGVFERNSIKLEYCQFQDSKPHLSLAEGRKQYIARKGLEALYPLSRQKTVTRFKKNEVTEEEIIRLMNKSLEDAYLSYRKLGANEYFKKNFPIGLTAVDDNGKTFMTALSATGASCVPAYSLDA